MKKTDRRMERHMVDRARILQHAIIIEQYTQHDSHFSLYYLHIYICIYMYSYLYKRARNAGSAPMVQFVHSMGVCPPLPQYCTRAGG